MNRRDDRHYENADLSQHWRRPSCGVVVERRRLHDERNEPGLIFGQLLRPNEMHFVAR